MIKQIIDSNRLYAELIGKGSNPKEALEKAFGKEVADKTKQQLEILNQQTNN
jgi:hypothetical protein